jgi:amino acid permease
MRGSIFALLASAMGSGMFNLPYRIGEVGVVSYVVFLLAASAFSYMGMFLISRLILQFRVESYSAMSEQAYGRYFKRVAEFCVIIYPWGITVCYQVLFTKFVLQLLADNFGLPLYEGETGRQTETYSDTGTPSPSQATGHAWASRPEASS